MNKPWYKEFETIQNNFLLQYPNTVHLLQPFSSVQPILSDEECNRIICLAKSLSLYEQTIGPEESIDKIKCNVKISAFPISIDDSLYDRLRQLVIEVNEKNWFFKLYDFGEPLKFMEYTKESGHFDLHSDFNCSTISKFRKLTIIVQLSDETEYEGGELKIQCYEKFVLMPKKRGTVIIFPSFLLHNVSQVTRGKRNSLVTFAYGPPFQ